jgi:hypothetical protein
MLVRVSCCCGCSGCCGCCCAARCMRYHPFRIIVVVLWCGNSCCTLVDDLHASLLMLLLLCAPRSCDTTPKKYQLLLPLQSPQQLLHPGLSIWSVDTICVGLSTGSTWQSNMSTSMDALLEGVNAEFGGRKGQVQRPHQTSARPWAPWPCLVPPLILSMAAVHLAAWIRPQKGQRAMLSAPDPPPPSLPSGPHPPSGPCLWACTRDLPPNLTQQLHTSPRWPPHLPGPNHG